MNRSAPRAAAPALTAVLAAAVLAVPVAGLVAAVPRAARAAPDAPTESRALLYPEATAAGRAPPELRVRVDGTPVTVYLPHHPLDPRPAVHLLTMPTELGLRVAEHTAYLFTTAKARAGDTGTLTLTLADGRPLTFTVRLVPAAASADASVEVHLPEDRHTLPARCQAAVQEAKDALAECRESDQKRAVALIASLMLDAPQRGRLLEERHVRWRDKQHRIFVQAVDAVRLFGRTYLRLEVDNRDGSGKPWRPGAATVSLVGPGPRLQSLPVVPVYQLQEIDSGQAGMVVLSVKTPQVSAGAHVRLTLEEKGGSRHLVIEGLAL